MLHRKIGNHELYLRIRALARNLRQNPTKAEAYFWEKVRNRQLFGLKINRQVIIQCQVDNDFTKYYIADFHCSSQKMIVELDGKIHLKQIEEDLIRTEQLGDLGFTVFRFSNEQILHHWEEVEQIIKKFLEKE